MLSRAAVRCDSGRGAPGTLPGARGPFLCSGDPLSEQIDPFRIGEDAVAGLRMHPIAFCVHRNFYGERVPMTGCVISSVEPITARGNGAPYGLGLGAATSIPETDGKAEPTPIALQLRSNNSSLADSESFPPHSHIAMPGASPFWR